MNDGLLLERDRSCVSILKGSCLSREGDGERTCRIRNAHLRSTVFTTKTLLADALEPVRFVLGETSSTRLKGPEEDKVDRVRKSSIAREFEAMRFRFGGRSIDAGGVISVRGIAEDCQGTAHLSLRSLGRDIE